MDKASKLILIIAAAITGALLLMALIWALIANSSPTDIKRVIYQNNSTDKKIDTDDRGAMIKVADAMKKYGIEKGDKFCLDYDYYSWSDGRDGLPAPDDEDDSSSVELKYSATIYWSDGTEQKMDCMAMEASTKERSQIRGFRSALEAALASPSYDSRYDVLDY